ncbi:MAG: hypothetical protein LBJ76_06670 [Candidatus Accumulibacter sp.]|nr:hypothetical protein [Accumulibacter sp.]
MRAALFRKVSGIFLKKPKCLSGEVVSIGNKWIFVPDGEKERNFFRVRSVSPL